VVLLASFPLLGDPVKGPPINFAPILAFTGSGAKVQAERNLLCVNQKRAARGVFLFEFPASNGILEVIYDEIPPV
jgi:hypothetical protein